jgi:hypothetical protein
MRAETISCDAGRRPIGSPVHSQQAHVGGPWHGEGLGEPQEARRYSRRCRDDPGVCRFSRHRRENLPAEGYPRRVVREGFARRSGLNSE